MLIIKVEEIHTTLRKHLAKEEAQLLPLLLQHFSYAEQAELVAQFLYCIPLATVERVLSWLKPMVPQDELQELMQHLRDVIPDRLLLQLLVTWLSPLPTVPAGQKGVMGAALLQGVAKGMSGVKPAADDASGEGTGATGGASSQWPPLRVGLLLRIELGNASLLYLIASAWVALRIKARCLWGFIHIYTAVSVKCSYLMYDSEPCYPTVLFLNNFSHLPTILTIPAVSCVFYA